MTQKAIRDGIPPPNKLITMLKLLTPFALLKLYNEYIAYTAFTPCNAYTVAKVTVYIDDLSIEDWLSMLMSSILSESTI